MRPILQKEELLMTRHRKHGKRIYMRYFMSYCCIAIVPMIAILIALLFYMQQNFTNSSKELYQHSIVQSAAHVDSLIQELQRST